MTSNLQILDDFPVTINIPVAWGEMDSYNHVNNTVYFKYFESAQVKYFELLDIFKNLKENGFGAVIHKISCTYMIPLVYPDSIQVGARITEVTGEEISFEFFILSEKKGLSAFGESIMVMYDFKNAQKVKVPSTLIEAINKIEKTKF